MLQTYINIMKGQTIPQKKNTLAITLSDKRTQKEYQLQFILSNMTTTRNENAQNICNPKAKDTLLIIYGYRILK